VVGGWISVSTVAGTRLDPALERVLAATWDLEDDLGDPTVVGKLELLLYVYPGTHDPEDGDEALYVATGALVIRSRNGDRSRFLLRGLPRGRGERVGARCHHQDDRERGSRKLHRDESSHDALAIFTNDRAADRSSPGSPETRTAPGCRA
jgi:hypothetical protein